MDKASPPLDLAALDIFRTVAAEGSVTRAAERLQRVQSNVTTRVRQLEADLGTPLFLREGKRMALTPEGEVLRGYADRLLALAEEARQAVGARPAPRGPPPGPRGNTPPNPHPTHADAGTGLVPRHPGQRGGGWQRGHRATLGAPALAPRRAAGPAPPDHPADAAGVAPRLPVRGAGCAAASAARLTTLLFFPFLANGTPPCPTPACAPPSPCACPSSRGP